MRISSIPGGGRRLVDGVVEIEFQVGAFAGEAAQAPQRDLDVARAEFARFVVVLVGALLPDLDGAAVAAGAADADALRVVAAVAEGRRAVRADPLGAAFMAALLFLQTLLQRLHQFVPAERADRGLLLGREFPLEQLAQPIVGQAFGLHARRHAIEEASERLVEAVEERLVLDQRGPRQVVELVERRRDDAGLECFDQGQVFLHRHGQPGRAQRVEERNKHGRGSVSPISGAASLKPAPGRSMRKGHCTVPSELRNMAFFTRLRIGRRLGMAFATIVTLTLLAAIVAQVELQEVGRRARELTTLQAERTSLAYRWREGIVVNATRAATLGVVSDVGLVTRINADMARTTATISEIQKRLEAVDTTPRSRAIAARMADIRKTYIAVRTDMLKKAGQDSSIAASVARGQAVAAFQAAAAQYIGVTDELVKYEEQQATEAGADIATAVRMSSVVSLGAALACALVSVLLGVAITRSIVRPVRDAELAAQRIASGDLTGELRSRGSDEAAHLVESLGRMQGSLRRIVQEIRQSTDSIQVASAEVAMGNQDLSQRTEQTAGSLQQAASSMEELTTAVRHSADAAAQANGLAGSASEAASRGGRVVSQVVSTMDEINLSSKKIADIVGTIDGIAFQTNILALNAAVEAARAGEQGRGFAVVAGEVRTLAQRSAEAAKEIKALIGTSVRKVETGARLVEDAGSAMAQIVDAVRRVSDVRRDLVVRQRAGRRPRAREPGGRHRRPDDAAERRAGRAIGRGRRGHARSGDASGQDRRAVQDRLDRLRQQVVQVRADLGPLAPGHAVHHGIAHGAVAPQRMVAYYAVALGAQALDGALARVVVVVGAPAHDLRAQCVERVRQQQPLGAGVDVGALRRARVPGPADFQPIHRGHDVVVAGRAHQAPLRQVDHGEREPMAFAPGLAARARRSSCVSSGSGTDVTRIFQSSPSAAAVTQRRHVFQGQRLQADPAIGQDDRLDLDHR